MKNKEIEKIVNEAQNQEKKLNEIIPNQERAKYGLPPINTYNEPKIDTETAIKVFMAQQTGEVEKTAEEYRIEFINMLLNGTPEERRRQAIAKQKLLEGRVDGAVIGFCVGVIFAVVLMLLR
jgi:hypothetical protein